LGRVGKHTNLIGPSPGSFVFLGELLTPLALPPDAPLRKSCGSCARCVDVCPTGALRGDYTIDATRCIADLTQRTDAIPRDLRALVGDWVWGCDLCQLACPPTRAAGANGTLADAPVEPDMARPSLPALLRLRSAEFKRRYSKTAMGWRGSAVLRRNAAVALGNALDRSAIPALALALDEDPHPMVRAHAAWALGRIGAPSAISALQRRDGVEVDATVREEIRAALQPHHAAHAYKEHA
ncbi:MAG: tRNA epoxyqueuosine(34) reductase QueG, partial [Candidatus Eremiobacteraeota bacterium]|nr:tRNA epoxyqueuosine(34) reductase QueG [Candidatus Eremiobacteraeota bacterium]